MGFDLIFDNEKNLKTSTKSYRGKRKKKFYGDGIPHDGSYCICLSVILIDSVFKMGRNYLPQEFLEECKYIVKEKMIDKYINNDLEISCDDSDEEDSDDPGKSDPDKSGLTLELQRSVLLIFEKIKKRYKSHLTTRYDQTYLLPQRLVK